MLSVSGYRPSTKKVVLFSLLGLVLGLLHPVLFAYQTMFLVWLPCIYVVAAALLYAGGGLIPACVLMGSGVIMSGLSMDLRLAAALIPLTLLPAAIVISGIAQRKPFFEQMRNALIASVGGALLALVLATVLIGGDMVAQFMDMFRDLFEQLLPSLYQVYQPYYEAQGITISYDDLLSVSKEVLSYIQVLYETNLPAAVLTDAVLTAVIAVFWGNWVTARHGEATSESFKGLADWQLPGSTTIGLLIAFGAAAILSTTGFNGVSIAWTAIRNVVFLVFAIVLLAANDRRLRSGGASRGKRTVLAILFFALIALFSLLKIVAAIFGALIALFGPGGVVAQKKDRKTPEE